MDSRRFCLHDGYFENYVLYTFIVTGSTETRITATLYVADKVIVSIVSLRHTFLVKWLITKIIYNLTLANCSNYFYTFASIKISIYCACLHTYLRMFTNWSDGNWLDYLCCRMSRYANWHRWKIVIDLFFTRVRRNVLNSKLRKVSANIVSGVFPVVASINNLWDVKAWDFCGVFH